MWWHIDWQHPWLAPYRSDGERIAQQLESGESLVDALNALATQRRLRLSIGPLRFVAHGEMPEGMPYEAFIARRARVPTRDNGHDLFNALVWLRFPTLKRRLNELQAEQIALAGIGHTRGAVRDALTLFDENAALWRAPSCLVDALRARDWHALFITQRAAWRDTRLTLFGHALLDKLTQPRKTITAHLWVVPEGVDAQGHFVNALTPEWLARKQHLPLPVLGVPGWWPANETQGFYDDASVFRRARG